MVLLFANSNHTINEEFHSPAILKLGQLIGFGVEDMINLPVIEHCLVFLEEVELTLIPLLNQPAYL